MLVDRDNRPERSVYYIGALVLDLLRKPSYERVDLEVAYRQIAVTNPIIPFNYFLLSLDWLYLIGVIDVTEDGDIVKCF